MKLKAKNIAASIALSMLVAFLMASIFQARWLAILGVCLVSLLLFFLSWQIGVKKEQNF